MENNKDFLFSEYNNKVFLFSEYFSDFLLENIKYIAYFKKDFISEKSYYRSFINGYWGLKMPIERDSHLLIDVAHWSEALSTNICYQFPYYLYFDKIEFNFPENVRKRKIKLYISKILFVYNEEEKQTHVDLVFTDLNESEKFFNPILKHHLGYTDIFNNINVNYMPNVFEKRFI